MSSEQAPPAPSSDTDSRPVASRPPESATRLSELPPAEGAERLASRLLDPDELEFVRALRNAGVAKDLQGDELLRVATAIGDGDPIARRVDLLEAYYAAGGDERTARARKLADRLFVQRANDPVTAGALVARLSSIAPELGAVKMERIGSSADAPLVLRAGEHFVALLDDYEESLDTDEIDLRELEERRRRGHTTMVTVRGLVRAVNVLLDRHGVRDRLVALSSDDDREVYIATSVTEAIELARGGWLDDENVEDVMELGGW
ncbi:hypothetical protein [Sandaracinus amylolyticus]|uniref:Uncharacterized protein n=1 Tax=Sandaracinus amylolyticus TaxID=927083 RepID=A0A0F6W6R7_9BACT|nr:hypothetical protein [Sandaracinus amylolyticus]AKF08696.1 hypothetical protein DB32_005845 [Sandaracinus amylolyticus]